MVKPLSSPDHIITTAKEEGKDSNLPQHLSIIKTQNALYVFIKSAFILKLQNCISLEYTSMCTEVRLKMQCPNRLMKLNWYMFIYTDCSGFMEATHSHLFLILIDLRRARENVFTSLFKSKRKVQQKLVQTSRGGVLCDAHRSTTLLKGVTESIIRITQYIYRNLTLEKY